MNTSEDVSNLSVAELEKRKNILKVIMVTWIVILAILFGAAMMLTITQGFNVFSALPVVFLPGFILSKRRLTAVNVELQKRAGV